MIDHKTHKNEYYTWCQIKQRCLNKNHKQYKDYGERGIIICDRWLNSFQNFIEDMKSKPSKLHQIDRIDNNGNYEPGNCRWATPLEQARNRRTNKLVTYKGETHILKDWAEILDVPYKMLWKRYKLGWSVENMFTLPSGIKPWTITKFWRGEK